RNLVLRRTLLPESSRKRGATPLWLSMDSVVQNLWFRYLATTRRMSSRIGNAARGESDPAGINPAARLSVDAHPLRTTEQVSKRATGKRSRPGVRVLLQSVLCSTNSTFSRNLRNLRNTRGISMFSTAQVVRNLSASCAQVEQVSISCAPVCPMRACTCEQVHC